MPFIPTHTTVDELRNQLNQYLSYYSQMYGGMALNSEITPVTGGGKRNAYNVVVWNAESHSALEALKEGKAFESEIEPGPLGTAIRAGWNMYRGDTSGLTPDQGFIEHGFGMPREDAVPGQAEQSSGPQIGGMESLAKRIAISHMVLKQNEALEEQGGRPKYGNELMEVFGRIERFGYGAYDVPPNIVQVSPQESGSRVARLAQSRNVGLTKTLVEDSRARAAAGTVATQQMAENFGVGPMHGGWVEDAEKLGPTFWMRGAYADITDEGEADIFLEGSAMGGKNRAQYLQRPEAIIGFTQGGRYQRAPIAPSTAERATVARTSVRSNAISGGQVGIRGTAIMPIHGFPATSGASLFVPPQGLIKKGQELTVGFQGQTGETIPGLQSITQLFHTETIESEGGVKRQEMVPNFRFRQGLIGKRINPTDTFRIGEAYVGDVEGKPTWRAITGQTGARKAAVESTFLYLPRAWQDPQNPGQAPKNYQPWYDALSKAGINYAFRSDYGEAEMVANIVQQDVWSTKTGTKTAAEPYAGKAPGFYEPGPGGEMVQKYPDMPTANYVGTAKSLAPMMPQMLGGMPLNRAWGFLSSLYPQMSNLAQGAFVENNEIDLRALGTSLVNPSTKAPFRSFPVFMQNVAQRAFQLDPETGEPISLNAVMPNGQTVREQQLAQARKWSGGGQGGPGRLEGWVPFGQKAAWTISGGARVIDLPGSPQTETQKNVFMEEAVAGVMQSTDLSQEQAQQMVREKFKWEMSYISPKGRLMRNAPKGGGGEAVYTGFVRDEAIQMPELIVPSPEYSGGANAVGMELQQAAYNISPELAQFYGFVPKEGVSEMGVNTPTEFNPQTANPSRYALERAQMARIANEWGSPIPQGATVIGGAGSNIPARNFWEKVNELGTSAGSELDDVLGLQEYIGKQVGPEFASNLMSFPRSGVSMISPADFLANEKTGLEFSAPGTDNRLQRRSVSRRAREYMSVMRNLANAELNTDVNPQVAGFGASEQANRLLNLYVKQGQAGSKALNSPVMRVAASSRYTVSGQVPSGHMFLSNNEVRRLAAIAGVRGARDIRRYGAALSGSLAVVARDPIPAIGTVDQPGSVVPLRVITGSSKGRGRFIQRALQEAGLQDEGTFVPEGLLTWQGDSDKDPLRYLPTVIPYQQAGKKNIDYAKFEPGEGAGEEQIGAYGAWVKKVMGMSTPESQRTAFNLVMAGLGTKERMDYDPLRSQLAHQVLEDKSITDKRVVENYLGFGLEAQRSAESFSSERTQSYNVFKRSALAAGTSLGMPIEESTKLEDLNLIHFQKAIDLQKINPTLSQMLNTAGFYKHNEGVRFGYLGANDEWNMMFDPGSSTKKSQETMAYQISQNLLNMSDSPTEGLARWLTAVPQPWTEEELSGAYASGNAGAFMHTRKQAAYTQYQENLARVTPALEEIRKRRDKDQPIWDVLNPLVEQGLIGERSPAIHAMIGAALTRSEKNQGMKGKLGLAEVKEIMPTVRFGPGREKTLEQMYYETEPYRMSLDFLKGSSGVDALGRMIEPIYENPARFSSLMQQMWKIGEGTGFLAQSMWKNFGQRMGAPNPANPGDWSMDIGGKQVTMSQWGQAGQSYARMAKMLQEVAARTAQGSISASHQGLIPGDLEQEILGRAENAGVNASGVPEENPQIPGVPGSGGGGGGRPPIPPVPPAPPIDGPPPTGSGQSRGPGVPGMDVNALYEIINKAGTAVMGTAWTGIKGDLKEMGIGGGGRFKTRRKSETEINAEFGQLTGLVSTVLGAPDAGDPTTGRGSQFQKSGFLGQVYPQIPKRLEKIFRNVPGMKEWNQQYASSIGGVGVANVPAAALGQAQEIAGREGINLGALITQQDPELANWLKQIQGLPERIRGTINNEGYGASGLKEQFPDWDAALKALSGNAGQENFLPEAQEEIAQIMQLSEFSEFAGVRAGKQNIRVQAPGALRATGRAVGHMMSSMEHGAKAGARGISDVTRIQEKQQAIQEKIYANMDNLWADIENWQTAVKDLDSTFALPGVGRQGKASTKLAYVTDQLKKKAGTEAEAPLLNIQGNLLKMAEQEAGLAQAKRGSSEDLAYVNDPGRIAAINTEWEQRVRAGASQKAFGRELVNASLVNDPASRQKAYDSAQVANYQSKIQGYEASLAGLNTRRADLFASGEIELFGGARPTNLQEAQGLLHTAKHTGRTTDALKPYEQLASTFESEIDITGQYSQTQAKENERLREIQEGRAFAFNINRERGLQQEFGGMSGAIAAEGRVTLAMQGLATNGPARLQGLERIRQREALSKQAGVTEDIGGIQAKIGEQVGAIQAGQHGWGTLGQAPTSFGQAQWLAQEMVHTVDNPDVQKMYTGLPKLFAAKENKEEQLAQLQAQELDRQNQRKQTPVQREVEGEYATHMQKVIALEKTYTDTLKTHSLQSQDVIKAQHNLNDEMLKWSKGVEGSAAQLRLLAENLPGGGAGLTGGQAKAVVESRVSDLRRRSILTPEERKELPELQGALQQYARAPSEEKELDEKQTSQRAQGSWARRLLGGFGLMYLRSIGNIIMGSTQEGYAQTQEDQLAAAQSMSSQMGGAMAYTPQQEQVRRAQALYGGGAYKGLQTAYTNVLRNAPGVARLGEAAVAGIGMYGLASYALPIMGVSEAVAGPAAGVLGVGTAITAGALNVVGAMADKQNVAIQATLAQQTVSGQKSYQTALGDQWLQYLGNQGNIKGGIGSLLGTQTGGGPIARWVAAGFDTTKAEWATNPAVQRQAAILGELQAAKSQSDMKSVWGKYGVSQTEQSQLMGLLGRVREQNYTNIPMEGIMGATALQGAYNIPFQNFETVATALGQGRPIEQTSQQMQLMGGIAPAQIYGINGNQATMPSYIESLANLSTPQLTALQSGAQFASGLGQNVNYWEGQNARNNGNIQSEIDRFNKLAGLSGTPAGDLYTQAIQQWYNDQTLGKSVGPKPKPEDFLNRGVTGMNVSMLGGMMRMTPQFGYTAQQISPQEYGERGLANQQIAAMQQATGNVQGILTQQYGWNPATAQQVSGRRDNLLQQQAYYQQLQTGAGVLQNLTGMGINTNRLQAELPFMSANRQSTMLSALSAEPTMMASLSTQMTPDQYQALSGMNLQGFGGPVSGSLMFMSDINMQGKATGLNWGTSSGQMGQTPAWAMANQIWGNNWNTNNRLSSGMINAWQGIEAPWKNGNGQSVVLGGQQGAQLYQANQQYEQTMSQVSNQLEQLKLNFAFTTGVGINAYSGIKNPQTGSPFGFNTGQSTWNVPGIGSYASTGGGFWGNEDASRTLGYAQQEYGFQTQQQQMEMQNRFFLQNSSLNRTAQLQSRTWTREDWGYQDTTRNLNWQWRQEDYQEQARFLTGRERKLAERQMGRETTMHGLEGEQIDKTRERQVEVWKQEDQRYKLQMQQQKESLALQKEMLEKSKQFYDERKRLEQESVLMQRAMWTENMRLQEEATKLQAKYAKENHDMQLTMLALDTWTQTANGSLKTLNQEALKPFLDMLVSMYPEMKKWVDAIMAGAANQTAQPATPPHVGPGGQATGGNLRSRQTKILGDLGPELFTPDASGYTTPSFLTAWNRAVVPHTVNTNSPGKMTHVTVMIGSDTIKDYIVQVVDEDLAL